MTASTATMNLDEKFLALLRCPVTRQTLRIAPPDVLARIDPPLDAGLIREDGRVVYPVRSGIPMLLAESAIPLPP